MMYSVREFFDDPDRYSIEIRGIDQRDPYHLMVELDNIEDVLDTISFRMGCWEYKIPNESDCTITGYKDGHDFFYFAFKNCETKTIESLVVRNIKSKEDFQRIKKRVEHIVAYYTDEELPSVCYNPKKKEYFFIEKISESESESESDSQSELCDPE